MRASAFCLLAPFDRMATIMQTRSALTSTVPGPGLQIESLFKEIWKTQGLASFWRGNTLQLLAVPPAVIIQICYYKYSSNHFELDRVKYPIVGPILSFFHHISGILLSGLFVHPLLTMKAKSNLDMGTGATREYKGISDCFKGIRVSFKELYRGMAFGNIMILYINIHYFRLQEYIMQKYVTPNDVVTNYFILIQLGLLSGICLNCLIHPVVTVVNRLMVQTGTAGKKYKGPVDCIVQTVKNEGIMGLYRGVTLTSFQTVIQIFIIGYVQDFGDLD